MLLFLLTDPLNLIENYIFCLYEKEFHREGLDKAVKFVSRNQAIFHIVSSILRDQVSKANVCTVNYF